MNNLAIFSAVVALFVCGLSAAFIESDSSASDESDPSAFIKYTIRISKDDFNNVVATYSLDVPFPTNVSFFQVMNDAAKLDSRYKIRAKYYEEWKSHYITSIGGLAENPETKHYWMYGTITQPSGEFVLAPVGVDSFYPTKGDHMVFWYKKVDFSSGDH